MKLEALRQHYDAAFAKFLRALRQTADESNTLFVFTADERDHFAGGTPSPANCDGLNIPCTLLSKARA